jgi:hypothetical protein
MSERRRQESKGAESVVDGDTDKILRRVTDHRWHVQTSSTSGVETPPFFNNIIGDWSDRSLALDFIIISIDFIQHTWCPDDDGQFCRVGGILRPENGQRQAIFALRQGRVADRLRTDEAVVGVVEYNLLARLWGNGVLESQLSKWRGRIWN